MASPEESSREYKGLEDLAVTILADCSLDEQELLLLGRQKPIPIIPEITPNQIIEKIARASQVALTHDRKVDFLTLALRIIVEKAIKKRSPTPSV